MSILDSKLGIETRPTYIRRLEDPSPVGITLTERPVGEERYNGYTYEQGYETRATIATRWYANQAQYSDRLRLARKEMLYFMYGPIIHRFNELRARACDRDYREVLRIVDELERELVE